MLKDFRFSFRFFVAIIIVLIIISAPVSSFTTTFSDSFDDETKVSEKSTVVVEDGSVELEYIIGAGRTNWALAKYGSTVQLVENKGYVYGGHVSNLIDGDPDTNVWFRVGGNMSIELTLPKEIDLVKVAVKSEPSYQIFKYDIYIQNSTTNSFELIGTGSGDSKFTFDPIKSEKIKLRMHVTQGQGRIFEIEAYSLSSGYLSNGELISTTMTSDPIMAVTPRWNAYVPSGTSVNVNVSNDNGRTWENVEDGVSHIFRSAGNKFRYKIYLTTTHRDVTPSVSDISFSLSTIHTEPTEKSIVISWETAEKGDSLIKYGRAHNNYTSEVYDATYSTSHSLNITGLRPGTTYYYIVNSTGASGNSTQSAEYSFTTDSISRNQPGFESVFTISCMFAVAYLLLKREK
ncbi:MAG: fibronectin type III domain-containing protein [Halobacteriota archaeon]|nr:fibronectin type III domain-containing protein [Halobacteriota archaeon]